MRRPRPIRRALRLILAGLLAVAVLIAVVPSRYALVDWDGMDIDAERARRWGQARLGQSLPGTPDLGNLDRRLAEQGLAAGAPVFIRIFKREFELELWMKRDGRFHRFAVYPICRWSGRLGPKLQEGDWQAPEGFYTVDAKALNPNSQYHRSFNLGFPNAFDRAQQRTGSLIMVHGACASVGCFAMTDPVIDELWRLVTAALKGGQKRFHVHVFPFRMTDQNLDARSHVVWAAFWENLKQGYDVFDATQLPPRIAACRQSYSVLPALPGSDGSHEIGAECPDGTGSGQG